MRQLLAGTGLYILHMKKKIKNVSTEDVKRVANKYIVNQKSTVGYFIPENPGANESLGRGVEAHRHHNGPYALKKCSAEETGGFVKT